jgi:hypothetical protein
MQKENKKTAQFLALQDWNMENDIRVKICGVWEERFQEIDEIILNVLYLAGNQIFLNRIL